MAGELRTQLGNRTHEAPQCPLCEEPLMANWNGRLYGVIVCESCRRAFARRRAWAFVVDMMMLGLIGTSVQFAWPLAALPTPSKIPDILVNLLFAFSFFRDGFNGQSPGKRMFDLQVTHQATGTGIGFGASAVRNLPMIIYPTVFYMFAELKFGPRIGDGMAKTKVIWRRHRDKAPFLPPQGHCYECGYDMTGNVSGKCPECGTAIILPQASPTT